MDDALKSLRAEVKDLQDNEQKKLEEEKKSALNKIEKEVEEVQEKRRKEMESTNQKVSLNFVVMVLGRQTTHFTKPRS